MELRLIVVGKTNTDYILEGIDEYIGRLKRYVTFRLDTLPDIKTSKKTTPEIQKREEGKAILSRITASDIVVLLDERGREYTSESFSDFLQKQMLTGQKRLTFVIGGAYGFSEEVYKRADQLLSLSKMTFNHEMVRMFFVEQLYRAMTILKGDPYHHS